MYILLACSIHVSKVAKSIDDKHLPTTSNTVEVAPGSLCLLSGISRSAMAIYDHGVSKVAKSDSGPGGDNACRYSPGGPCRLRSGPHEALPGVPVGRFLLGRDWHVSSASVSAPGAAAWLACPLDEQL